MKRSEFGEIFFFLGGGGLAYIGLGIGETRGIIEMKNILKIMCPGIMLMRGGGIN